MDSAADDVSEAEVNGTCNWTGKVDDLVGAISTERKDEDEDDWETIADAGPPDLGISRLTTEDRTVDSSAADLGTPKRRGRGSFLYQKNELYSDDAEEKHSRRSDSQEDWGSDRRNDVDEMLNLKRRFGTRHILVLYDLPLSTNTVDLEKLLGRFGESGVAIRWVNDTCALAVFRTPSLAYEAENTIKFPFKVRTIDEDDSLLDRISPKELEPPCPRPKTSARTAHRMIAQVMGIKPSTEFGSSEFKKQEQARKNRMHTRQSMKNDAWGPD